MKLSENWISRLNRIIGYKQVSLFKLTDITKRMRKIFNAHPEKLRGQPRTRSEPVILAKKFPGEHMRHFPTADQRSSNIREP